MRVLRALRRTPPRDRVVVFALFAAVALVLGGTALSNAGGKTKAAGPKAVLRVLSRSAATDTFELSTPPEVTAGEQFTVTITAKNGGQKDTGYEGAMTFAWNAVGNPAHDTTTPDPPSRGSLPFTDGVATTLATYYGPGPAKLTAIGPTPTSTSTASFTVVPGPLDRFEWMTSPGSTQTAGQAFGGEVVAYDAYDNVKTNYAPSADAQALLGTSGLGTSPSGKGPEYGSFDWTTTPGHGILTGVTDYRAESSKALTIEDGNVQATSLSFTVGPDDLNHFDWTTPESDPVAGTSFDLKLQAEDQYDNLEAGYTGANATLSDLGKSPPPSSLQALPGTLTWNAAGEGTLSGVTDYRAGAATLKITDGNANATGSVDFTVDPDLLASFVWKTSPGPTETAGKAFGGEVIAYDQYDNVKTNYAPSADAQALLGTSGLGTSPSGKGPEYGSFDWTTTPGHGILTGVTDYKAESSKTLTISDGGVSESSSDFTVDPGPLASFVWDTSPDGTQTAGVAFDGGEVTAFDPYGNVKTNYPGGSAASLLSGLHASPSSQAPVYGNFVWTNGVGTLTGVVDYKAETTTLTIADTTANVSQPSAQFTVDPGPLDHFGWTGQPGPNLTAGVAFGAQVTAYDAYGNVKTNYSGANTKLSGLAAKSPSPPAIFGNHPGGFTPNYGSIVWGGGTGVGTVSGVVDYDAESPKLTITDTVATVSQQSAQFTVAPATPDALAFTQQPIQTQVSSPIDAVTTPAGVRVQAIDAYSNLASNTSVSMAIGANPGSGTLGGTAKQSTDSTGTATFNDLTIDQAAIGYTLVASAPGAPATATATKTSLPFEIAHSVTTCTSSCSGSATVDNSTLAASATFGTGALARTTAPAATTNTATLALALLNASIPSGVCPGLHQTAGVSASFVNIAALTSGGAAPTITVTWTVPRSAAPRDEIFYDICLGAENLKDPQGTGLGYRTKGPFLARPVIDPIFNVALYWGVLPNCLPRGKSPGPCVSSRKKDRKGNLVIVYVLPYPWDATGHLGG